MPATIDNKASRRAVLGALAVIPAVIAAPAFAQADHVDTAAWDRAYAAWVESRDAYAVFCDHWERVDPICDGTGTKAEADAAWEAMRAACPAFHAARDAFMAVPAPHHRALLAKLEVACVSLDDDHATSALNDARRLLSAEA